MQQVYAVVYFYSSSKLSLLPVSASVFESLLQYLIRGHEMLSQNSQVVSLSSPAPTAFEAASLSQSQNHRDASHESETEERAHAQDEESLEKEREALKEDEYTEDKKLLLRPSDIALRSAEYDEVWILLTHTDLFMLTAVEEGPSSRVYRPPLSL